MLVGLLLLWVLVIDFCVVVFVLQLSAFSTKPIIQSNVNHMQYHFLTTFRIMLLFIHRFVDKPNLQQI